MTEQFKNGLAEWVHLYDPASKQYRKDDRTVNCWRYILGREILGINVKVYIE